MLSIPIEEIAAFATNRPESYRRALLAAGAIEDGKLLIDADVCARIHAEHPPTARKQHRGLGDVVAAMAQPIAGALDAVLGTDLQNCGGCKERQELLNQKFPGI
jgi:hypothetical protein